MGARIDDGFATLIEFSSSTVVKFWEKSVTPPGIEGGGENDTTTMRNTTWRTKSPKQLMSLTQGSATVAYDPTVLNDIVLMINVNQAISITFPDSSVLTFWGWLDSFKPGEISEGAQPTAEIVLVPSNQDANGDEIAPTVV